MVSNALCSANDAPGSFPVIGVHLLWAVYLSPQTVWGGYLDRFRSLDPVSTYRRILSDASLTIYGNSGAGLMLLFSRHTSIGAIVVIVLIQGIGVGFTFQPTLVAFQAHCTKAHRAVIISNRNFFRCLGGACGLAVSAAILQAVLKSNLPERYQNLAHSTYSLPSRSGVADADWEQIITAYAKASRGVFILQVPLIGICFLACFFIKDRGLERPKDPGEEEAEKKKQQNDDGSRGSQEHAAREDGVPSDLESQSASTNIANRKG